MGYIHYFNHNGNNDEQNKVYTTVPENHNPGKSFGSIKISQPHKTLKLYERRQLCLLTYRYGDTSNSVKSCKDEH